MSENERKKKRRLGGFLTRRRRWGIRPPRPRIRHNIKRLQQMGLAQVKRTPKATFPNALTTLNMFLGYSAIHATIQGEFITAVWIIYIATFTDLLDGRIAKLIGATSRFGAEFDSLTDMLTFGVAPAFVLHQAFLSDWGWFGIAVAFFPLCFSALRLARFNSQWPESKSTFFQGIPTPVGALLVAGFVGFAYKVWGDYRQDDLAAIVAVATAFLMFSNIRFESNVIEKRAFSQTWKLIPFVLSILSVIIFGVIAIFPWAAIYVLIGLTRWIVEKLTLKVQSPPPQVEKDLG